jgi:vitamin B12 transporter
LKLDMSLRRSENKGDRDDFDFINIRPDGFEGLADTGSAFESVLTVGRIAATLDTFDGKWVHQWQIGGSESDLTDCCGFAGTSNFNIERMNYSYRSTATIDTPENPMVTHYLTGLVDHQTQKFQQSDDFANSAFDLERTGVAAELRGEYFRSLFLSAAVRHDQNDSFENYTTWQTSASYRLPGSIFRLHGAAGSGVKYPSLLELYGEFGPGGFTGNPNLKPEESIGWDGGIETTLFGGRAIVDVTYFNQKLENEIFTSFSPAYTVNNKLGASTREGIEFTGRFAVAAGLDLGLSYTYLRARESDNPAGTEEIRRPPHSGRIDVNYRFLDNRANINLAAAYIGDRFDQNFNYNTFSQQALALDSYWLLTLGASYLVTPNMEVYGRVENLLDQKYTEIIGIDSAPIAAYVGVKIKYDDPKSFGSSNN